MTDLDTRLGALRDDPALAGHDTPPSVDVIEARAARRRHRRHRLVAVAVVVPVLLLAVALFAVEREEHDANVVTGPPTTPLPSGDQRSFGGVTGVTLTVTPSTGLRSGDVVEVRVDRLENLPDASIVMCTGDVTEQNAINACDFYAVREVGVIDRVETRAGARTQVVVPRSINVGFRSYDCATEPAGCVLAVGPITLPARGVIAPLQFVDEPIPTSTIAATPSTGLANGQPITVIGEGLPPNALMQVSLCRAEPTITEDGPRYVCDSYTYGSAGTDPAGRTTAEVRAWATLYDWTGSVDCTVEQCVVAFTDPNQQPYASAPLTFLAGEADRPRLRISPPGPYADQQVVTVTGTGFRPGIDVGGDIGQCPNDKDTSVEERCGRSDITSTVVGDDGSFTMQFRLTENLMFTGSCKDGPGCHLGWVLNHGPTLAKAPLTFR